MGRRDATAEVKRTLEQSRLVTLVGMGGVGKSRLAVHVAGVAQRGFPDGVHLVELAKVQDQSLVVHAIIDALDLRDQSTRSPEAALADHLSDKTLLLVIDNCEHVLESCSRTVSQLLASAPNVSVLATSREPLNIAGESVWPVPPLSIPDEALTLFEHRASAAVPGFTLDPDNRDDVARLCTRLDGLPLAIELAAVRLRMLAPAQILLRLEHRFDLLTEGNRAAPHRHRTLQAAVAWSFDLCSDVERALWARCAVFPGEFDLDAAEFVCLGDGLSEAEVFTGIAGLVDKSVLLRTEAGPLVRYRMLETIREFGIERLGERDSEARLRRRHRDYYLAMAEQCDAESCDQRQLSWVTRLTAERANLFAALDYCVAEQGETRAGLRMGAALWFYWIACGAVRDGRHWLDRMLAADTEPSAERARALLVDGWATIVQGDAAAGGALLDESLAVANSIGDAECVAYATQTLGLAKIFNQDPEGAAPLLDLAIAQHRTRPMWTAPALIALAQRGFAAVMVDDVDRAVALAEECRDLCLQRGERWVLSWVTYLLALTQWIPGDLRKAHDIAQEALRQKIELNDQLGMPFCVELLAWVAVRRQKHQHAATLFGTADALWKRIGTPLFGYPTMLQWSEDHRSRARTALGRAAFDALAVEGGRRVQRETPRYLVDDDAQASPRRVSTSELTNREREVAELVASGLSNIEVATRLVISRRTAEAHVEHILAKLGFTNRTQIAGWVARQAS